MYSTYRRNGIYNSGRETGSEDKALSIGGSKSNAYQLLRSLRWELDFKARDVPLQEFVFRAPTPQGEYREGDTSVWYVGGHDE